jgi:hypothetical protein
MRPRLTYANVMATAAVFIALGGASYAALKLPKNSVGQKQLQKNAVTAAKLKKEAVTGSKVKKGTLTGTQINVSKLGIVPTAVHATSADNATQLGGLDANAYEHANQIERFGPLEDATAGTAADAPTVSFGPFSFGLYCQYISAKDEVSMASSEPHAFATWTVPDDAGTVEYIYANDLGPPIAIASSAKAGAYSKPVEGWALSPSGLFRMHFSLWFGRGILGADKSTCSFGGEFRRG